MSSDMGSNGDTVAFPERDIFHDPPHQIRQCDRQEVRILPAERDRQRSLRVIVNEQNPLALTGKADSEILDGRCFGNTAFLVTDRYHGRFLSHLIGTSFHLSVKKCIKKAAL